MLVGIKPTVGRISRYGVIPITAVQDTPGPMGRSVADAAALLGAMEGATPDPNDPATRACTPPPRRDSSRHLRTDGLKGARIGIPRAGLYARVPDGAAAGARPLTDAERRIMADATTALTRAGATVVDPANLPSVVAGDAARNVLAWSICVGRSGTGGRDAGCSIVFQYGMKRDFTAWLSSLGDRSSVKTLADLRAWNRAHEGDGALRYGQDQLDGSDAIDLARDRARYLSDREKDLRLSRREGIDAALEAARLDALLFPAYYGSAVAARAGYPSIIVPFGMVPIGTGPIAAPGPAPRTAPLPQSPFGVTFTGTACSEPRLIEIAYAFEQATKRRVAPVLD
jgi:amidase